MKIRESERPARAPADVRYATETVALPAPIVQLQAAKVARVAGKKLGVSYR